MTTMRSIAAVIVLLAAVPAAAQSWVQFESLEDRFRVNFPAEPIVEPIEYLSEFDAILPARRYTAETDSGVFIVESVDFTDAARVHAEMDKFSAADFPTQWINDMQASVARAARQYRQRGGEINYDAWAHVDRIAGHQLQITNEDGTVTYVGIYLDGHSRHLHVLEATVPPSAPPPVQFQQSLEVLNADGMQVRYEMTPEGCSYDPAAGG
ncbi:MAG TPA: hypothetical protein VIV14_04080 [Gammaproteobacteria bacterium]